MGFERLTSMAALGLALAAAPDAKGELAAVEPATPAEATARWESVDAPHILAEDIVSETHRNLLFTTNEPVTFSGRCPGDDFDGWEREVKGPVGTHHSATVQDTVGGRIGKSGAFVISTTAPRVAGMAENVIVDCVHKKDGVVDDRHTLVARMTAAGRGEMGGVAVLPNPFAAPFRDDAVETEPDEEPEVAARRKQLRLGLMDVISMNDGVHDRSQPGVVLAASVLVVDGYDRTTKEGALRALSLGLEYDLLRVRDEAGPHEYTGTTHCGLVTADWMPVLADWAWLRAGVGMGGCRSEQVRFGNGDSADADSTFVGQIHGGVEAGDGRFFGGLDVARMLTNKQHSNVTTLGLGGGLQFH